MSKPSAPQIAIESGRAWLKCTTPGCRKRLAEIAPGTLVATGWLTFHCRGCKVEYRLQAEAARAPLAS